VGHRGPARQDGISIGVSGLGRVRHRDLGGELDDAKKLLDLGIGSETLKKQVFKRLALKYLSDARQEVKNQVAEEIDRDEVRRGNFLGGILEGIDVQAIVRQAIEEFATNEQSQETSGLQGGTAGGAQAQGATGAPAERVGGGEQAQPPDGAEAERQLGRESRVAAAGRGQDRPCVQAVQDGIVRTEDGRLVAGARRANAAERTPDGRL